MSCIGRRNQKIGDVEFTMRRVGGVDREQGAAARLRLLHN